MEDIKRPKTEQELIELIEETVLGTPGVSKMAPTFTENLQKYTGLAESTRGIKINLEDDGYHIDVYIIVEYGVRIPGLAWEIQTAVQNKVKEFQTEPIHAVDIHIQGVLMPE